MISGVKDSDVTDRLTSVLTVTLQASEMLGYLPEGEGRGGTF